ncbi:MAG: GNAT family N-acetyltransferase [Pseudomonadota bacterium]
MTELANGTYEVSPSKVPVIVTHLEMRAPAPLRDIPWPEGVSPRQVEADVVWYRKVFATVGADWMWFGRLQLSHAELADILANQDVEIFTLSRDGEDLALLELRFQKSGTCQLEYFGLAPSLIGTGAGRGLMNVAIARAWRRDIDCFAVHTCTVDSPQALGFYIRSGFKVTRRQVEIADDPRLKGLLPRDKAGHFPIITC